MNTDVDSMSLPVACSLTDSELQERRRDVLQQVRNAVIEVQEVENGYTFSFPSDEKWVTELANLVKLERQCCLFLRFNIIVEPGDGPIRLEMTGPPGTKEFLQSIFN